MVVVTEESYDGAVAQALVAELYDEINDRYAAEMADWTEAQVAEDAAAYRAEVTVELTTRPRGAFVVAWLDGEPVGCGAVKPMDDLVGVGEVKRMYTAARARRRGVSRAVLRRLEEVAAELGYRSLQLETGTEQPEAMALYESHGWVPIECYGRYKDEPSSRCYAKDLAPDSATELGTDRATP